MTVSEGDLTVLDVISLEVLDQDQGEISLLLHHGRSLDLRFSMRTLPRVIIALFSLASGIEDHGHARMRERRVFALPIKDIDVTVISTEEGRRAVISVEFGNRAVFRFLLNQELFRKLSGALDGEFDQVVH